MSKKIPEHILERLPDFDESKYEYSWGVESSTDFSQDWEFWQQYSCKWVPLNSNRGAEFIHRRLRAQYLSVEPEDARIGDEKLSWGSGQQGRQWIPYNPDTHKTIRGCAFRRKIES